MLQGKHVKKVNKVFQKLSTLWIEISSYATKKNNNNRNSISIQIRSHKG